MNYAGIPAHAGVSSAGHECGSDSLLSFFLFPLSKNGSAPTYLFKTTVLPARSTAPRPKTRASLRPCLLIYSAHLGWLSKDKESAGRSTARDLICRSVCKHRTNETFVDFVLNIHFCPGF